MVADNEIAIAIVVVGVNSLGFIPKTTWVILMEHNKSVYLFLCLLWSLILLKITIPFRCKTRCVSKHIISCYQFILIIICMFSKRYIKFLQWTIKSVGHRVSNSIVIAKQAIVMQLYGNPIIEGHHDTFFSVLTEEQRNQILNDAKKSLDLF